MSLSSCETGVQAKSTRLFAHGHMADSLRETVRTSAKSMMQLLATSNFSYQSGAFDGI